MRALEVVQLTGRPFSAALPTHVYAHEPTTTIGLEVSREVLDARIEARVDLMWRRGLVDEVRRLEAQGLRDGRTAARALGYAQVLAFLAGRGTEQQARDGTAQATRRFARRQLSWWRKDPRIGWLAADPDAGADDLVDRALARLGGAAGSDV